MPGRPFPASLITTRNHIPDSQLEVTTSTDVDFGGVLKGVPLSDNVTLNKIGDDDVRLKAATVTTCTQPVPYWSFSVSSATIRMENYARMWNVRVRASRVPFFYLPYLIWPIKQDRASGLLLPELQISQDRKSVV